MNKCKGCEWYGKPYWSIINPCDNCPRENTSVEIFTRWQDPTIEQLQQRINELELDLQAESSRLSEYARRCLKALEYNEHLIRDARYNLNSGHLRKMKKILQGEDK